MQVVHRPQDLNHSFGSLLLCKAACPLKVVNESPPRAQLHDHVDLFDVLKKFVEFDNVWVVDTFQDLDLVLQEELLALHPRLLHKLHRADGTRSLDPRFLDATECAFSEVLALHPVAGIDVARVFDDDLQRHRRLPHHRSQQLHPLILHLILLCVRTLRLLRSAHVFTIGLSSGVVNDGGLSGINLNSALRRGQVISSGDCGTAGGNGAKSGD
mmetsp:Transcript_107355/g.269272  ORF Transcript_107355/g.269272 Transcript_107355/m.269272 type:complete len:213 (-) Transcript_107355:342-980(-)